MRMLHPVLAATMMMTAAVACAEAPTDAQIASTVVTANQVDIDAGNLAQQRAHSSEVRAFAKQMVTDHTAVNSQAVALVTRLKVTPQDNATGQSLAAGGVDNLRTLKTLKGAAFDRAYVDHEVAYHQQVIDALDKSLIPGAQNAELKALLIAVRPAFVGHLQHAQEVQAKLSR